MRSDIQKPDSTWNKGSVCQGMRKDSVLESLRKKGCRITRQRQILLDIILQEECASCKEIYYKAAAIDPSISVATVYRMINLLEEIGVISRKSLYRILTKPVVEKEITYTIRFADEMTICLPEKEWYRVLSAGLTYCGYANCGKITDIFSI